MYILIGVGEGSVVFFEETTSKKKRNCCILVYTGIRKDNRLRINRVGIGDTCMYVYIPPGPSWITPSMFWCVNPSSLFAVYVHIYIYLTAKQRCHQPGPLLCSGRGPPYSVRTCTVSCGAPRRKLIASALLGISFRLGKLTMTKIKTGGYCKKSVARSCDARSRTSRWRHVILLVDGG